VPTTPPPETPAPETTVSSTSTTTEPPAGAELVLRADGLGTALFGAEADGVISYVNGVIGVPTSDSGWIDPLSTGGACPGTMIRFVSWRDLTLFFSDQSTVADGIRHFVSYRYGPPFGAVIEPAGLRTEAGVSVGSTVADLAAAYPGLVVSPGDELSGPSFLITDGLFGFTSGTAETDAIFELVGGFGCGE
jgi:hypothetical protein